MFDEARAAKQADPVLAEFFGGTANLSQVQIDFLVKRHNVSPLALARDADGAGMIIGAADIVLDGERLFDWAAVEEREETVPALIIAARDAGGEYVDLCAWCPRSDKVATRFGRSAVLGEQTLHGLRFDGPPRVHRGVLAWLLGDRNGIVVIDPRRAGRVLLDAPDRILVEDEEHAAEIAGLMTASVDLSRIICPTRRAAA